MKKIVSALLILMLTCASAFAAPTREMQAEEAEITPGMQMLLETVLGAASLSDTSALTEGASPPSTLVEAALALGVWNLSLPVEGLVSGSDAIQLSEKTLENVCGQLFAAASFAVPNQITIPGVYREADGLSFDPGALSGASFIGVNVYSVQVEQTAVDIKADLYAYDADEIGVPAEDIPEEGITWLRHADVRLMAASQSGYGYVVKAFSLSPVYQAGCIADWSEAENEQGEYSLNLPSHLELTAGDPLHSLWQTADGAVQLRIDVDDRQERAIQQVVHDWQAAQTGLELSSQPEFGIYCAWGEDVFQSLIVMEETQNVYTMRLQFPPERLEEYRLYSEFIINSMNVWGISNG